MTNKMERLAARIAHRDAISLSDARMAIEDCLNDVEDAVQRGSYDDAEEALRWHLGLEPDYLELFLFEIENI